MGSLKSIWKHFLAWVGQKMVIIIIEHKISLPKREGKFFSGKKGVGGTARCLSCTPGSHFPFLSALPGVTIDKWTARKQLQYHSLQYHPDSADSLKCKLLITPFQSNLIPIPNHITNCFTAEKLEKKRKYHCEDKVLLGMGVQWWSWEVE